MLRMVPYRLFTHTIPRRPFYSKSDQFHFTPGVTPVARGYVKEWFTGTDERGPFRTNMLTGPGTRTGSSGQPWKNFDPTSVGRHWAIPATLRAELPEKADDWATQECLDYLNDKGWIYIPREGAGQLKYKQYLSGGIPYQDVWAYQPYTQGCLHGTDDCIDEDVKWLQHDAERLPYPTQKPEGLLRRVIESSCPPDGMVLDPFCGCGTSIAAAQLLKRQWIGIDITHLAIGLIKHRLRDAYGPGIEKTYEVHGEPVDLSGAKKLAEDDKFEFQAWALGLVGARRDDQKKGADRGIDGRLYFHDEGAGGKTKGIILSVKGGHLKATDLRDLRGVVDREKAAIGVLISLDKPSGPMRKEAASGGFYVSPWDRQKYPRLQLRTVEELLDGRTSLTSERPRLRARRASYRW